MKYAIALTLVRNQLYITYNGQSVKTLKYTVITDED